MRSLLLVLLLVCAAVPSRAQDASDLDAAPAVPAYGERAPDGRKAFLLSLALPGLGHRYANGSWRGAATAFALADIAAWTGLGTTVWRRDGLRDAYVTLAADRAQADVEGKDRTFFLTIASYESSDAYLESRLRARAWDDLDYVSDPSFQWAWESDADLRRYRELRDDHESLGRRRAFVAGALVLNRLVAGLTSVRAAGRAGRGELSLEAIPPVRGQHDGGLRLRVGL